MENKYKSSEVFRIQGSTVSSSNVESDLKLPYDDTLANKQPSRTFEDYVLAKETKKNGKSSLPTDYPLSKSHSTSGSNNEIGHIDGINFNLNRTPFISKFRNPFDETPSSNSERMNNNSKLHMNSENILTTPLNCKINNLKELGSSPILSKIPAAEKFRLLREKLVIPVECDAEIGLIINSKKKDESSNPIDDDFSQDSGIKLNLNPSNTGDIKLPEQVEGIETQADGEVHDEANRLLREKIFKQNTGKSNEDTEFSLFQTNDEKEFVNDKTAEEQSTIPDSSNNKTDMGLSQLLNFKASSKTIEDEEGKESQLGKISEETGKEEQFIEEKKKNVNWKSCSDKLQDKLQDKDNLPIKVGSKEFPAISMMIHESKEEIGTNGPLISSQSTSNSKFTQSQATYPISLENNFSQAFPIDASSPEINDFNSENDVNIDNLEKIFPDTLRLEETSQSSLKSNPTSDINSTNSRTVDKKTQTFLEMGKQIVVDKGIQEYDNKDKDESRISFSKNLKVKSVEENEIHSSLKVIQHFKSSYKDTNIKNTQIPIPNNDFSFPETYKVVDEDFEKLSHCSNELAEDLSSEVQIKTLSEDNIIDDTKDVSSLQKVTQEELECQSMETKEDEDTEVEIPNTSAASMSKIEMNYSTDNSVLLPDTFKLVEDYDSKKKKLSESEKEQTTHENTSTPISDTHSRIITADVFNVSCLNDKSESLRPPNLVQAKLQSIADDDMNKNSIVKRYNDDDDDDDIGLDDVLRNDDIYIKPLSMDSPSKKKRKNKQLIEEETVDRVETNKIIRETKEQHFEFGDFLNVKDVFINIDRYKEPFKILDVWQDENKIQIKVKNDIDVLIIDPIKIFAPICLDIGDIVKITSNKRVNYIITGLEDCRLNENEFDIKCMRGFNKVYLKRKTKDESSIEEISTKISNIYLPHSLGMNYKYKLFDDGDTFQAYLDHQLIKFSKIPNEFGEINDNLAAVPKFSALKSNSVVDSISTVNNKSSTDGPFNNCLFLLTGVTYSSETQHESHSSLQDKSVYRPRNASNVIKDEEETRNIISFIKSQGGIIDIENGFDHFLPVISSTPFSSPRKNKKLITLRNNNRYVNIMPFQNIESNALDFRFICLLSLKHSRTLKYLQCLCLGYPILQVGFIKECMINSTILNDWENQWIKFCLVSGDSGYLKCTVGLNVFRFYEKFKRGEKLKEMVGLNKSLFKNIILILLCENRVHDDDDDDDDDDDVDVDETKVKKNIDVKDEKLIWMFTTLGVKKIIVMKTSIKYRDFVDILEDFDHNDNTREVYLYSKDDMFLTKNIIDYVIKGNVDSRGGGYRYNKRRKKEARLPEAFIGWKFNIINWEWFVQCIIANSVFEPLATWEN